MAKKKTNLMNEEDAPPQRTQPLTMPAQSIGPLGPRGPQVAPRMPSPRMPKVGGIKGTTAFKSLMKNLKGRG